MFDWDHMVRVIEEMWPVHKPDTDFGYHACNIAAAPKGETPFKRSPSVQYLQIKIIQSARSPIAASNAVANT